jgi:hypothetical protein
LKGFDVFVNLKKAFLSEDKDGLTSEKKNEMNFFKVFQSLYTIKMYVSLPTHRWIEQKPEQSTNIPNCYNESTRLDFFPICQLSSN